MSDDTPKNRAREITGILADLDLFFDFSKTDPGQKPFWVLAPFSEKEEDHSDSVPMALLLDDSWLTVFSMEPLKAPLTNEQAKTFLLLNPQLALVKVGVVEEDNKTALWIGQQIAVSQINLDALKMAIGVVTVGTREVRRRLESTL